MNIWVLVAVAIIFGTLIYSLWQRVSYAITASIACVLVFVIEIGTQGSGTVDDIAFKPGDLTDPARLYTVLTSMYAHASLGHIFMNLLALIFIGIVLEQRIGTPSFIGIYLVAGLCGTLAFAFTEWDANVLAVGASAAIIGVLGAFARLFPRERMILFPIPIPVPAWVAALMLAAIQFIFIGGYGDVRIAWQAHLGGLAAGIVFAPTIVNLMSRKREKKVVSATSLRRLATTPQLREIYHRIETEEIADVRSAWIQEFLGKARCPHCGSAVRFSSSGLICKKGHLL